MYINVNNFQIRTFYFIPLNFNVGAFYSKKLNNLMY